jgi:hypothetical protein
MGTETCAVDGCTALEFRTTGRCLNHQNIVATPHAASSGPSTINFSNPGHAPYAPEAITFSEDNPPTVNATDGGEGTLVDIRDVVHGIPVAPSPVLSLVAAVVLFGSPFLYFTLNTDPLYNGDDPTLCCLGMVVGLLVLLGSSSHSSSIKKRRWRAFQQVAIAVDGNDERCPEYPHTTITLLCVAGVLLIWVWGLGVVFLIWAFVVDIMHQQKVKAFEAWARATYR